MIKIGKIQKVIIGALIVRLMVLFIIFVFTPDWSIGFSGTSTIQDDVRFEAGAMKYAEIAVGLFDPEAFTTAFASYGDYTGLISNIFDATPLWYWIVCIVFYIFRNVIFIRILNISLSVISVYLFYKLVSLMYNNETALCASKLLAFLPYPIIFACFSYKDNLVMFLTIYLLYHALNYRITKKLSIKNILWIIIATLLLFLVRGGLAAILVALCCIIGLFNGEILKKRIFIGRLLLMMLSAIIVVFIISKSMNIINEKIQAYIINRNISELGGISFVSITNIRELYKLPFTFLFAIVMPIGFSKSITSWFSVVSILNICMASIAIGATIDLFLHKKHEWIFLGACLGYYSISIIASIGIYRHYFSLLFIPIMLFSHLKNYGNKLFISLWLIGSILYSAALVIYVFF